MDGEIIISDNLADVAKMQHGGYVTHALCSGGSNLGLMGIAPAYSLHPTPVRGEIAEMKQQIERKRKATWKHNRT